MKTPIDSLGLSNMHVCTWMGCTDEPVCTSLQIQTHLFSKNHYVDVRWMCVCVCVFFFVSELTFLGNLQLTEDASERLYISGENRRVDGSLFVGCSSFVHHRVECFDGANFNAAHRARGRVSGFA